LTSGLGPVGKLAYLNTTLCCHETRQKRCPSSLLEVHEISLRYHQPFLNSEENAEDTVATAGRRLGDLAHGVAVEREYAFGWKLSCRSELTVSTRLPNLK